MKQITIMIKNNKIDLLNEYILHVSSFNQGGECFKDCPRISWRKK